MVLSGVELSRAREAAGALLEEVGLENFLFSVDPREEGWEIKVEHPVAEGWERVTIPIDRDLLIASGTDGSARKALADSWRARLAS